MTFSPRTTAFAVLLASLFSVPPASAGGAATGGATEITQLMNNGELVESVAKQAQSVSIQLNQYTTMMNQYMTMVQNLKNLPAAVVAANLAPFKENLKAAAQLYTAVDNVYIASTNAQQVLARRYSEMKNMQLSPSAYMMYESLLAQKKAGIYQQQYQSDMNALQQAELRSRQLDEMGDQINLIHGNVNGLQMLAQQNRIMAGELIQMNSKIYADSARKAAEHQQNAIDEQGAEARAAQNASNAAADRSVMESLGKSGKVNATAPVLERVCARTGGCGL